MMHNILTTNQEQSDYDRIIFKYANQISQKSLKIMNDKYLTNINFVKFLNVHKLELENCKNLIPKLHSSTITELSILQFNIQNIQDFELENLEVLTLISKQFINEQSLINDIVKFKKLNELNIRGYQFDTKPLSNMKSITYLTLDTCQLQNTQDLMLKSLLELYLDFNTGIDITSLQHLNQLTNLSLNYCDLANLDSIRSLINLNQLDISGNENIDITSIQYLTKLQTLSLASCGLIAIDALQPVNLVDLNIQQNHIVYIQPIIELKLLSMLNARYNTIIDISDIQPHRNFNKFKINAQQQPQKEIIITANILRSINKPIRQIRQIYNQYNLMNITFRQKIAQCISNCQEYQLKLFSQVSLLFQRQTAFESDQ
ncbi:tandem-95_repeat protein [Hexamita inflata]|uniref:Tandem-95 repeat protein n=1 Tax=Hexamita inflata TaxID=28002 RepID=A0AA86V6Y1_9EUKA|nr:tandem-95 repeat protein [Hexamita inflata]